ncbi:VOC family protein [Streptomyces sp. NPDC005794]|uniref:VOC family protein n=1 Tax=Streptomyces sp. NPDC005794 TaxID=3364733 RepID=UPI0036BC3407
MADARPRRRLGPGPRPDAQRIPRRTTPRLHLDLFTETAKEQQEEVRRLVGLGAEDRGPAPLPPEPDFVVLADPDGNVLCVVDLSHARPAAVTGRPPDEPRKPPAVPGTRVGAEPYGARRGPAFVPPYPVVQC